MRSEVQVDDDYCSSSSSSTHPILSHRHSRHRYPTAAHEPTDSQAPTKHQSTKPAHPAARENGAALHSSTTPHHIKRWTRRKQHMHKAACSPTQLIRPSRASTSNQANDTHQPPESNLFKLMVPGNRDHGQLGKSVLSPHVLFSSSSRSRFFKSRPPSSTNPQTQVCQECLPLRTSITFHVSFHREEKWRALN